ncbi:AAA family ATPase [Rhizobium sp. BR 315]|uniref:AAA family ATPase n=1 Tax=Rhizobium sp. BR 315 TaxID=3040014 RepID=UPI003D3294F3
MEQIVAPQALSHAVDIDRAARILEAADRVLVIGCSGTGKSTLAQAIASLRGLAYVSMDRDIFWLPGWKLRPRPQSVALIEQAVAGSRWIMDGNSPGTLPLRLPRADIVIWRRSPRHVALRGVISRWLRYRGRSRPEMAPGCPERLDWKFLHYTWTFERNSAPELQQMLVQHGHNVPMVTLRSYRDGEELLSRLRSKT